MNAAAEPTASARIPAVAFQNVVGSSQALRRAVYLGCRVAEHVGTTVLIQGETGTGKELFARGVHYSSPNASEPFVAINCSAIPEHLLESELFGHEKGAFSGAIAQKKGLFEFAGTGTLFLDEIGDLPKSIQPKLLRVLEERRVRRLGGLREVDVSCRIVAATNQDMLVSVAEGKFRADLFHRLNAFTLELPPLRERLGDIELLARFFCDQLSKGAVSRVRLAPDALDLLRGYHWPGNVRELKNVIEGALIVCDGEWVRAEHLRIRHGGGSEAAASAGPSEGIAVPEAGITLRDAERQLIRATLDLTGNNISRSARMLGISRPTILRKMDKYGFRRRSRGA
jgi:transcriptional regulator with PAS, ATPase and Fis domain